MAVFTQLSEHEVEHLLACYSVGELVAFEGVPEGSRNTVYRISTTVGSFILRLTEGEHFDDEVPGELAFMRALRRDGFPCPDVLQTRSGHDFVLHRDRWASLFSFIVGTKVSELPEPTPDITDQLGAALAHLHQVGRGRTLRRRHALVYTGLLATISERRAELERRCGADFVEIDAAALRVSERELDHLPRGIIHNDLFPDNVFVEAGRISGIIDFGECLDAPFLHDLAIVLNQWVFDSRAGVYDEALAHALLSAYQRVRPLEQSEVEALPAALLRAALTFIYIRMILFELESPTSNVEIKDYRDLLPILHVDEAAVRELARSPAP